MDEELAKKGGSVSVCTMSARSKSEKVCRSPSTVACPTADEQLHVTPTAGTPAAELKLAVPDVSTRSATTVPTSSEMDSREPGR